MAPFFGKSSGRSTESGKNISLSSSANDYLAGRFKINGTITESYLPNQDVLGQLSDGDDTYVVNSNARTANRHIVYLLRIPQRILDTDPVAAARLQQAVEDIYRESQMGQDTSGLLSIRGYNLDKSAASDKRLFVALNPNPYSTLRRWRESQTVFNLSSFFLNAIEIVAGLSKSLDKKFVNSSVRPIVLPETIAIKETEPHRLEAELFDPGFIAAFMGIQKYIEQLSEEQKLYFAPELQQKKTTTSVEFTEFTVQSYVFSLATVLLHLLTGDLSKSSASSSTTALPVELMSAIDKARNADPMQRFATFQEFLDALLIPFPQNSGAATGIGGLATSRKVGNRTLNVSWRDAISNKEDMGFFENQFIMIGSDSQSDIHLAESSTILPRHACLWQGEEGYVTLTDIDEGKSHQQRSPTLLNGVPLSPNFAALVNEFSHIQIGNYSIHLLPPPSEVTVGRANHYAEIKFQKSKISTPAGGWLRIPVTFLYHDRQVEEFLPILDSVPGNWSVTPLENIRFLQSGSSEDEIEIRLPTIAQSKAKTYELILRLISVDLHVQVAAKPLWVTILPEYAFESWVEPEVVKARRPFQLFVGNDGNFTQTFSVRCYDKEQALRFDPPTAQMVVRPNATGAIVFESIPYARHWWGSEKRHQVTVDVTSTSGGAVQSEALQITSRALIPGWILPVLASLLALAVILAMTLLKPIFTEQYPSYPNKLVESSESVTLGWHGRNVCFYSVSENGVVKEWLSRSSYTNTYTVTAPIAGQQIEITPRNCLFVAGTSWIVDIDKAPPTPTAVPDPPTIAQFKVSLQDVLIRQVGDICFGWVIGQSEGSPVDKLQIEPLIGEVKATEKQYCTSIQTLFARVNLQSLEQITPFTFTLTTFTGEKPGASQSVAVNLYNPVCKVKQEITQSYLWEGPAANFPIRAILQGGMPLIARTSPFYPVDRPGEGWLEVSVMTGDPRPGWVDLGTLDCMNISTLINGLPSAEAIPPTPLPPPTDTPTPIPTPEPTATPLPGPAVNVSVEPKIINAGGCVLVSWDIQNVNQIFLNGVGQVGNGEIQDCPTETKDYDWHIKVKADDSTFIDRKLTVIVNGAGSPGNPTPPVQQ